MPLLPKNLLNWISYLEDEYGTDLFFIDYPRVVWDDLTYPRVACFGAMIIDLIEVGGRCSRRERFGRKGGQRETE